MGKLGEGVYKTTKYIKDFVKRGFMNDTIFEDFGIDYLGPVDGHNIVELIRVLQLAQKNKKSVVVHVVTEKEKVIHLLKMIKKVNGMELHHLM